MIRVTCSSSADRSVQEIRKDLVLLGVDLRLSPFPALSPGAGENEDRHLANSEPVSVFSSAYPSHTPSQPNPRRSQKVPELVPESWTGGIARIFLSSSALRNWFSLAI